MTITVTDTATGSLRPRPAPFPDTVTNGDFLISPNPACTAVTCPTTGDGVDEFISWKFDFTGDPDFASFSSSVPLTSARLTLTLTPRHPLITTDTVRIEGLPDIVTPVIQGLAVGITATIQLDLLSFYTSGDILGVFAANAGQLPMLYQDDAIVSFAQLDLTQEAPAFQYAAKFVCGRSEGEAVARGAYFTAVNVHNPTNQEVSFRKKVAVGLPQQQPGPVSKFHDGRLGPDQALEIDCRDIFQLAEAPAEFLKGFVVIESDVELDVVVVYTAAGAQEQVETLHLERVPPRRRELGLPDLVPIPDPDPNVGFCRRDPQGRLIVTVGNQGTADAPTSTTRVEFFPGGVVDVPTPPIPAGGAPVDLPPIIIPAACFDPDCDFRITVDANNQVNESDEGNNTASGLCRG
jgi:hypothetical protein